MGSFGKGKRKLGNKCRVLVEKDPCYTDNKNLPALLKKVSCLISFAETVMDLCREGDVDLFKAALRDKNWSVADLLKKHPYVLVEACRWGNYGVTRYLLQDVRKKQLQWWRAHPTLLHEAARRGHYSTVKMLLSREFPVDSRDRQKETALHAAARYGKWPCCRLLIINGARTRGENKQGKVPADLAADFGCDWTVSVINDTVHHSIAKVDKLPLQSVYSAVLSGRVSLTAGLVKEMLVPENLHGIRDLWMGHNLLVIAWGPAFELYPKYHAVGAYGDKHYFFRRFYKHVIGKVYTEEEMAVATWILDSAESCGILSDGDRAGIEIGVCVTEVTAKKLAPIFHDLYHRIMRLEKRQDQLEENLCQIRSSMAAHDTKALYLAFVRLGLSFVPIAGGVAGASMETIGKVLKTLADKGIEVSDTIGMATALLDAGNSVLSSNRELKTDVDSLQSLQFRLSDGFINKMPKGWQVRFMQAIEKSGYELDRIREELEKIVSRDEEARKFSRALQFGVA